MAIDWCADRIAYMLGYNGDAMAIITDRRKLGVMSRETTIEECKQLNLFGLLEHELVESKIPGCGLASIQIGYDLRANLMISEKEVYRMINPEILEESEPFVFPNEGCLSDPGKTYNTNRYRRIKIKWIDYDTGKERTAVTEDFKAVVLQHELDHMNGILNYKRSYLSAIAGRNDPCPCGSGKKFKKCCIK